VPILVGIRFDELTHNSTAALASLKGYEIDSLSELDRIASDLVRLTDDEQNALTSQIVDPEDPQRGLWGGERSGNGRVLHAQVDLVQDSDDWFQVELRVEGNSGTLGSSWTRRAATRAAAAAPARRRT
jgi:hypothetical protein